MDKHEDEKRWEQAQALAKTIEQQRRHLQRAKINKPLYTKLIDKTSDTLEELFNNQVDEAGGIRFITQESVAALVSQALCLGYLCHEYGLDTDWPYITDSEAVADEKTAADSCTCPACVIRRELEKRLHAKDN